MSIHCTSFLKEGKQTVLFTFTDLQGLFAFYNLLLCSLLAWRDTSKRLCFLQYSFYVGKGIWCLSFPCLSRKSFRVFITQLCLTQPFSWNSSAYPTLRSQLYSILILNILWSKFWWKPEVPVAEIPGGQSPLSSSFSDFKVKIKTPIFQADLQQHSDKNHIWAIFCTKSQLLLDKPHLKSCNFSATIKQDKIPVLFSPEPVI